MYEGTNVSTSRVNAMLNAVFAHNNQEQAAGTKNYVTVYLGTGTTNVGLSSGATTVNKKGGSAYYEVVCNYTGSIITSINVKDLP